MAIRRNISPDPSKPGYTPIRATLNTGTPGFNPTPNVNSIAPGTKKKVKQWKSGDPKLTYKSKDEARRVGGEVGKMRAVMREFDTQVNAMKQRIDDYKNPLELEAEPTRPTWESATQQDKYTPDTAYQSQVSAARRSVQQELANLEQTRKARLAEINARISSSPTAAERSLLKQQTKAINDDAQRAAKVVAKTYGAATNEATRNYSAIKAMAANSAKDVGAFYDAAATGVAASNANAMMDASEGGASAGLGGAVLGGEALLTEDSIQYDKLRDSASAADSAAVRSADAEYLAASLAEEQANTRRDVQVARDSSAQEARLLWNQQVQARIAEERARAQAASDAVNSQYDGYGAGLRSEDRQIGLDAASWNAQQQSTSNSKREDWNIAQAMDNYERELAAVQGRNAGVKSSALRRTLEGYTGGAQSGGRSFAEITSNPLLKDAGIGDERAIVENFNNELLEVGKLTPAEQDVALAELVGKYSAPELRATVGKYYNLSTPNLKNIINKY